MKNVCGVWVRTSKKSGKKFMTGFDIRAIQQLDPDRDDLLLFKNEKKKEGSKEPDYSLVAVEKSQQTPRLPPRDDGDSFGF